MMLLLTDEGGGFATAVVRGGRVGTIDGVFRHLDMLLDAFPFRDVRACGAFALYEESGGELAVAQLATPSDFVGAPGVMRAVTLQIAARRSSPSV